MMQEIKRLSQQVVNQIAAGEVVERPASAVKELIENAIDAGATQVDVSIEDGGMTKIEVKDNGKGISSEDLPAALERYATSKLVNTEDLESITTYGFRGEALAAISSISATTILSRRNDSTYTLTSDNGTLGQVTPGSRAQGTTITIEHIFEKIPARQKFLKSIDTEYRYILKVFENFALLNGKTHFTLTNNGKLVYNLPPLDEAQLPKDRVTRLFASQGQTLLKINHEEYGIKTIGYMIHPKNLASTSKFMIIFINNRPVEDKGVARSLQQGISGFVPDFYKFSGVVSITLPSEQVDVNVHPRKSEVKLINPFRVYSAVTNSIRHALQEQVAEPDRMVKSNSYTSPVSSTPNRDIPRWERREEEAYNRLRGSQPQFFFDSSAGNNDSSRPDLSTYANENTSTETPSNYRIPEYITSQAKLSLADAEITPILGRYIIVGFMDEVWVVDQHAAAERVRYEQLKRAYLDGVLPSQQQLLVPVQINLTEAENIIVSKHSDLFIRLGFSTNIDSKVLSITSIPTYFQKGDYQQLIQDTINEIVEHEDLFLTPVIEDYSTDKNLSLVIATMACHNSVRMNERISVLEAKSIISGLLDCKIPYACPHGRRVVWRLSKEEVDKQFMRT